MNARPYAPGPELHAAVTALLTEEWQTVGQIAKKTRWSKPSIRLTLLALRENGYAEGEQRFLPDESRPAHGYVWVFRRKKGA